MYGTCTASQPSQQLIRCQGNIYVDALHFKGHLLIPLDLIRRIIRTILTSDRIREITKHLNHTHTCQTHRSCPIGNLCKSLLGTKLDQMSTVGRRTMIAVPQISKEIGHHFSRTHRAFRGIG